MNWRFIISELSIHYMQKKQLETCEIKKACYHEIIMDINEILDHHVNEISVMNEVNEILNKPEP